MNKEEINVSLWPVDYKENFKPSQPYGDMVYIAFILQINGEDKYKIGKIELIRNSGERVFQPIVYQVVKTEKDKTSMRPLNVRKYNEVVYFMSSSKEKGFKPDEIDQIVNKIADDLSVKLHSKLCMGEELTTEEILKIIVE